MFEPNPNCPLGEIYSTVGEDPSVLGGFDGKTEGREGILAAQKLEGGTYKSRIWSVHVGK